MSYTYLFSNINTMCFFFLLLVGDQRRSRNDGNDEDETNATQRNETLFSIYIISGFYL